MRSWGRSTVSFGFRSYPRSAFFSGGEVCIASNNRANPRCLYGALNDTIRMILLKFDVSKAVDPTQPFASFLMSLLNPIDMPSTTDITLRLNTSDGNHKSAFALHRFILAARNDDLRKNLETRWKGKRNVRFASLVHPRSIETIIKYLYAGEVVDPGKEYRENLKLVSESLHLPSELMELVYSTGLLPTAKLRDLKRSEMSRVQSDFEKFVQCEIIARQRTVNVQSLENQRVEMSSQNPVWADCLLCTERQDEITTVYYAHLAILSRSEYFLTMFTSHFAESKLLFESQELLPVLQLPIDPRIGPIILSFLYTDRVEVPREMALEVLYAADFLLLPRLKSLAAIALENDVDPLKEFTKEDLYDILRAAWSTNTQRLE